jgi:large subunit GTPase 1
VNRCEDLESYVKEMGKRNILLINKADFLTTSQRTYWKMYLDSIGLPHAFYSAAEAAKKLELQESIADIPEEEGSDEEEEEVRKENESEDSEEASREGEGVGGAGVEQNEERVGGEVYSPKILNRDELIEFLRSFKKDNNELFAVGLVGYPNVGKSSTINSLMAAKKTSVSATPGKTKHFQVS